MALAKSLTNLYNINVRSQQDFYEKNPDFKRQVSFKDGKEVKYGTKGSSRVDAYKDGLAVEIKNYDLSKKQNRYNLVRTLLRQYEKRLVNLPKGTKQIAEIDISGQNVPLAIQEEIVEKLKDKYYKVRFNQE